MLCEEFAYMNAIQAARPRGLNVVPVLIDDEGMLAHGPGGLEDVMAGWDKTRGRRPHIMYTVTMGQNPTSGLLSVRRRQDIYEICRRYDIIIVEDDPYWYLQYPSANVLARQIRGRPVSENYFEPGHNYNTAVYEATGGSGAVMPTGHKPKSSGSAFLDSLVPSYLSLDVDGRVVRLHTFSKTVAPGCRLGWITAQPGIIERIQRITETTTQQPSGFVQSLIAELLLGPDADDSTTNTTTTTTRQHPTASTDKGMSLSFRRRGPESSSGGHAKDRVEARGWKMDGWIRWLEGLRGNYERRMQIMTEVLEAGKYQVVDSSVTDLKTDTSIVIPSSPVAGGGAGDDFQIISRQLMYDFAYPMAGMFLWLHLNFPTHPLYHHYQRQSSATTATRGDSKADKEAADTTGLQNLSRAMWLYMTRPPFLVLLAPGTMFAPTPEILNDRGWQYLRLCFAAVDAEDVRGMSERVVKAIGGFWDIKDKEVVDKLLRDDEEEQTGRREEEEEMWLPGPVVC